VGCHEVIVLDTHAALWLANDDPALGPSSLSTVLAARDERQLAISAISFWEIALLTAKRRLELEQDAITLRDELLSTGIIEIPLTGSVAILAVELDITHGDPADRFIVATAIANEATLVTADRTLLRWRNALPRQDASK
jgi:PIN domain nuclease of toxin-antitoxin system